MLTSVPMRRIASSNSSNNLAGSINSRSNSATTTSAYTRSGRSRSNSETEDELAQFTSSSEEYDIKKHTCSGKQLLFTCSILLLLLLFFLYTLFVDSASSHRLEVQMIQRGGGLAAHPPRAALQNLPTPHHVQRDRNMQMDQRDAALAQHILEVKNGYRQTHHNGVPLKQRPTSPEVKTITETLQAEENFVHYQAAMNTRLDETRTQISLMRQRLENDRSIHAEGSRFAAWEKRMGELQKKEADEQKELADAERSFNEKMEAAKQRLSTPTVVDSSAPTVLDTVPSTPVDIGEKPLTAKQMRKLHPHRHPRSVNEAFWARKLEMHLRPDEFNSRVIKTPPFEKTLSVTNYGVRAPSPSVGDVLYLRADRDPYSIHSVLPLSHSLTAYDEFHVGDPDSVCDHPVKNGGKVLCYWNDDSKSCQDTNADFHCDLPLHGTYTFKPAEVAPPIEEESETDQTQALPIQIRIPELPECGRGFCCQLNWDNGGQWIHQFFIPSSSKEFLRPTPGALPTPVQLNNPSPGLASKFRKDRATIPLPRDGTSPYGDCVFYPYSRPLLLPCLHSKRIVLTGDSMTRETFRRIVGIIRGETHVYDVQWHGIFRLRVTEAWDALSYMMNMTDYAHAHGFPDLQAAFPHPATDSASDAVFDIIFIFCPTWADLIFHQALIAELKPNILIQSIQFWEADEPFTGRGIGSVDKLEYRQWLDQYIQDANNQLEHFVWIGAESVTPLTKFAKPRNDIFKQWISTLRTQLEHRKGEFHSSAHFIDVQLIKDTGHEWLRKPYGTRHWQCEADRPRIAGEDCFDPINFTIVQAILNVVCNKR